MASFPKISKLKTINAFQDHLAFLEANVHLNLPFETEIESGIQSPLARPLDVYGKKIGNRFCVLPMEGWDGTTDGDPTELTIRRWRRFGSSGAKLIWGGEAVAVQRDGRANPNQLMIGESNLLAMEALRNELVNEHQNTFGMVSDLSVGLQL
ncbi:MAG: NADH:flavin oxidoreductase, partial [Planctomycetota bacterium]